MPRTKKESVIFTLIMCSLMVLGMTFYNIALHKGIFYEDLLIAVVIGFFPGFIVALLVDVFIVAPYAKKLAFKLPIDKTKKIQVILAISGCMVCGMVLFMPVFGLLTEGDLTGNIFLKYLLVVRNNFIVALPLQWLIVGPIARYTLSKYQGKINKTSLR